MHAHTYAQQSNPAASQRARTLRSAKVSSRCSACVSTHLPASRSVSSAAAASQGDRKKPKLDRLKSVSTCAGCMCLKGGFQGLCSALPRQAGGLCQTVLCRAVLSCVPAPTPQTHLVMPPVKGDVMKGNVDVAPAAESKRRRDGHHSTVVPAGQDTHDARPTASCFSTWRGVCCGAGRHPSQRTSRHRLTLSWPQPVGCMPIAAQGVLARWRAVACCVCRCRSTSSSCCAAPQPRRPSCHVLQLVTQSVRNKLFSAAAVAALHASALPLQPRTTIAQVCSGGRLHTHHKRTARAIGKRLTVVKPMVCLEIREIDRIRLMMLKRGC